LTHIERGSIRAARELPNEICGNVRSLRRIRPLRWSNPGKHKQRRSASRAALDDQTPSADDHEPLFANAYLIHARRGGEIDSTKML
jgi:hypothetical protein